MYYIIIAVIVALDQFVKYTVKTSMELGQSIPIIENIFHLTYIHNYGAAFSIFQGQRAFLLILTGIMLVALLVFMIKNKNYRHWTIMTAMALIISGGIGNIIDRAVLGYVVDYLDFRVWPIFNVADIAVCVGCGLMVLYVLFIDGKVNNIEESKTEQLTE